MTENEKELVQKFKSLLEDHLHVYSVVVFGSRARGDSSQESDLDVLVVIEETETWQVRKFVYDCAWEAGFESGIVVSPIIFSRDRWENSPERASLLAVAIREEGIPV
jgi:uncharacterized protein